jgi:hypothetical protein
MPLPASTACSFSIAFSARRNSSPIRRCSTSNAAILICIDRPMARQSAKCRRQCGLTDGPLVSRAVDQSSHAQQIAMIDWGGKARIAGAGSVLREFNTLTRTVWRRSIKTGRTATSRYDLDAPRKIPAIAVGFAPRRRLDLDLTRVCFWPCWDRSAGAPNRPGLGVKQTCSGHAQIFRV